MGPHSKGPHDGDQKSFSTAAVQAVFRVLLSQGAFLSNSFRYKKSWEGTQQAAEREVKKDKIKGLSLKIN